VQDIVAKLGNMRKPVEWVIYPKDNSDDTTLVIQCDKRIAKVDMVTGKGLLSDGKGGHQGFWKLMPQNGAILIDFPSEVLAELKRLDSTVPVGPVFI
jgi:hypothetical protein